MDEDERDFLLSLPRPPQVTRATTEAEAQKKEDEGADPLKPRWQGVRGLDGSVG